MNATVIKIRCPKRHAFIARIEATSDGLVYVTRLGTPSDARARFHLPRMEDDEPPLNLFDDPVLDDMERQGHQLAAWCSKCDREYDLDVGWLRRRAKNANLRRSIVLEFPT